MTKYVYDGDQCIAEYDANDVQLRKYVYGPGIDQVICMIEVADANAAYFYHYDALGSVVALSDAGGDTVQVYEYDVYGQVAASDPNHPNPFMFTGRRFDTETGLYYYRARYYNAALGRFLQTDPAGQGTNWYAYCGNNSVCRTDPTGLYYAIEYGFLDLDDPACEDSTKLNCARIITDGNRRWVDEVWTFDALYDSYDYGDKKDNVDDWADWARANPFFGSSKGESGLDEVEDRIGHDAANGNKELFWKLQALIYMQTGALAYLGVLEQHGVRIAVRESGKNQYIPSRKLLNWNQNKHNWGGQHRWAEFGDPLIALQHELRHVADNYKADLTGDPDAEVRAMISENVARHKFKLKDPSRGRLVPRPGYFTDQEYPPITWNGTPLF